MNKKVAVAVVGVVALVGVYAGAVRYVGASVENEVATLATTLAERDDVILHRLDYERGFLGGTIHYDLGWRPPEGGFAHEVMAEWAEDGVVRSQRVTGTIAVRHGPIVGGGVRLARLESGVELPAQLRDMLPNYPGQTPLVSMVADVGLGGEVTARIESVDYDGRFENPDAGVSGKARFGGLTGHVVFDAELDWVRFELGLEALGVEVGGDDPALARMGGLTTRGELRRVAQERWIGQTRGRLAAMEFNADGAGFTMSGLSADVESSLISRGGAVPEPAMKGEATLGAITFSLEGGEELKVVMDGMSMEFDAVEAWPQVWTGTAALRTAASSVVLPDLDINIADIALRSVTERKGRTLEQKIHLDIGPIVANGAEIGGAMMEVSAEGFDGEAISELLQALESLQRAGDAFDMAAFGEAFEAGLGRLLAGPVAWRVDNLGMHMREKNDLAANFGLTFAGEPGLDFSAPEALIDRLGAKAGFRASNEALKSLVMLGVDIEARRSGRTLSAEEREQQVNEQYMGMMLMAAAVPFLEAGEEAIHAEAVLADGAIMVNGQPFADASDLVALAGLVSPFGGEDFASEPVLNLEAAPLFGAIELATGFEPDPHVIELTAGGPSELHGALGPDCIGHVDADQADVTVTFDAGSFPLFIFASSDADTSLIVRTPDGQWLCNDDDPARGFDPTVQIDDPVSGVYRIWVGTFDSEAAEASLMISEVEP